MLIPKEKPYLVGLNSYYLYVDKFIEHLQGEIGTGCLYCQSADQELLVYFDERDIVRGITQNRGERARLSQSLDPVIQSLLQKNFLVTIYYLDSSSIFFWGQMPSFKRISNIPKSTDISLPELELHLREKQFSGFVDVTIQDHDDGAILFFHQGERRVGSYSWGSGGGSPSEADYNRLLNLLLTHEATFEIGKFTPDLSAEQSSDESSAERSSEGDGNDYYLSSLSLAMKEFNTIFLEVMSKKGKDDPFVQLKQKFLEYIEEYPVLDPFRKLYEIEPDGKVEFADNVPKEEISAGIVDCAWKVIEDNKLQKKFRTALHKWDYKNALEERGIDVER